MRKPVLLFVNGPSGVGKSTLAKRLHEDLRFSVLIDIDSIKFSISQFRLDNSAAVKLAIGAGLAMATYILHQGYSVVMDRMIWGGYKSITEMKELCEKHSALFVHILLTASHDTVLQRANSRGYATLEDGGVNPEKISTFYSNFQDIPPEHVDFVIDTSGLDPEEVYEQAAAYIQNRCGE